MKHKYLDEVGIGSDRPDLWNKKDTRQAQWKEDRKIYGFDERDTWSLDYTWHLWLYEHLMAYKEWAAIDLNYHKFIYKKKEYTQGELIDMMLERLAFEFAPENTDWNWDKKKIKYVNEIESIWALVCHSMWW